MQFSQASITCTSEPRAVATGQKPKVMREQLYAVAIGLQVCVWPVATPLVSVFVERKMSSNTWPVPN